MRIDWLSFFFGGWATLSGVFVIAVGIEAARKTFGVRGTK